MTENTKEIMESVNLVAHSRSLDLDSRIKKDLLELNV